MSDKKPDFWYATGVKMDKLLSGIKPLTAAEYLDKWEMYGLEDIYGKEGKAWLEEQVLLDKQLPETNQSK